MDAVLKCAAVAVAGALLALVVRRQSGEFAALVSMGAVLALFFLGMEFLKPVLTFADTLTQTAGLQQGAIGPVMKTLAIGFVTETGKNICEDAGEKTVAGALQMAGGIGAFYVLLPLLSSGLELLGQML